MEVPQIKPKEGDNVVSGPSTGATNPKYPLNTHPGNQPDEYVKCPYFPEHELRRSRLPYHLIKCQKNPRAPQLLACPFNYLHRVRPEDRHEHVQLCEDRLLIKYSDRSPPSYNTTLQERFGVSNPPLQNQQRFEQQKSDSGEEWW